MQTQSFNRHTGKQSRTGVDHLRTLRNMALIAAVVLPSLAMADVGGDSGTVVDTTCKFLSNISTILNAVSVAIVTIAIIFSGYQIAFAHKRISDVAPIMIGAILIGAASQIAKMFLPTDKCNITFNMTNPMEHLAAATHMLAQYA